MSRKNAVKKSTNASGAFTPLHPENPRSLGRGVTGFTLTELLLAAAILGFVLVGLLALFINCILLNELNRSFTLAYNGLQAKMEEIKNTDFSKLYATCPASRPSGCFCNGDTFDLEGFASGSSKGTINIIDESISLKRIRVVACFMSRNRLIGDSINNCSSSPAELVTRITQ